MATKFNPPPNWPQPPPGWSPPQDWRPDPSWGPAPAGWQFWVAVEEEDPLPRIFISYRRSDCQSQANGVYDGLSHRMQGAKIFMDLDSIPPGADFEKHIREEIEVCDLVLVMIGDNWLGPRPGNDIRRIDEPDDFVRLEIESALESPRVQIVPVLVEGAQMPRAMELPENIRGLARINAIELSDKRWTADLQRLTSLLTTFGNDQRTRAQGEYRSRDDAPAAAVPAVPVPAVPVPYQRQPGPAYSPAPAARPPGAVGWLVAFLPIITFSLANFAPPLRAALQRPEDAAFRRKMFATAAGLEAAAIAGFVAVGVAPTDSEGNSTGVLSDLGVAAILATMVVALVIGIIHRAPRTQLPGTAEELARRQARRQYRELVASDPELARSINVGRPELTRDFIDGGLLDLNSVDVQALTHFGRLPAEEAQRIVVARQQLGRLSSVDEAAVYANLSEPTAARLREIAVFL